MDDDDDLEVVQLGSYDVSIVPTVNDVKRLNRATFEVSPDTENVLRTNYPVGFAFLVAQLRESGSFHPIGYIHPIIGDRLFIPTRHEHGGRPNALPKWDHKVFHQGVKLDVTPRVGGNGASVRTIPSLPKIMQAFRDEVTVKAAPLASFIDVTGPLSRVLAEGPLPNIDLTVQA